MSSTATRSKTVQEAESVAEDLREGTVDSQESSTRYLAYAARIRTLLIASSRYLAYTSDIGEAFRPVAHPYLVRSAYIVSFGYVGFDVAYEGYKAKYIRGRDNLLSANLMAKRAAFQGIASVALPALSIHTTVNVSSRVLGALHAPKPIRTWAPTSLGLVVVPFLPYILDHPVEMAIDRLWDQWLPKGEQSFHLKHE